MIDLTPLDVRKKKGDFRRGLRGYEQPQVDDFLDVVADRLEALVRENQTFNDRVTRLEQQVAEYREREKALTEALVSAQEMREEMRAQVAREADLSRRTAEQDAERIRAGAVQARDREEDTLRRLRGRQLHFLQTYRTFLEKEMAELASMAAALELTDQMGDALATGHGAPPAAGPPRKPVPPTVAPPASKGATPPRAAETWEEWGLEPPRARASGAPAAGAPAADPPRGPGAAPPAPSGTSAGPASSPLSAAATAPAPAGARPVVAGTASPPAGASAARPGLRPERTAFAAGVAGASLAGSRGDAGARPAPGSVPVSPAATPPVERTRATPAEAPEAELILSDADVLPDADLEDDMNAMFGMAAGSPSVAAEAASPGAGEAAAAGAAPASGDARDGELLDVSFGSQSFFAADLEQPASPAVRPSTPPGGASRSSGELDLDLVPEFEDFGEFGDLGGEPDDDGPGLPPEPRRPDKAGGPSADAQPKRRDDPNDDPEDLLSTLFGDDR